MNIYYRKHAPTTEKQNGSMLSIFKVPDYLGLTIHKRNKLREHFYGGVSEAVC